MDGISLGICVPSHGTTPYEFTFSLAQLTLHLGSVGLRTRPGKLLSCTLDFETCSSVSQNREKLVTRALERGNTHVLFLDHDMYFPVETVESLFGHDREMVACNYLTREKDGPKFVAHSPLGHPIVEQESSTGIEEALYTGFGVSLIRAPVFDAVEQPWFQTNHVAGTSKYTTEDVPFFLKARKAGFTLWVDHDASKPVEHVGSFRYGWKDHERLNSKIVREVWTWKV